MCVLSKTIVDIIQIHNILLNYLSNMPGFDTTTVDNVSDTVDGNRGFSNVGTQYNLPGARWWIVERFHLL